jgi:alpha-L-glutamate ligase-like protein
VIVFWGVPVMAMVRLPTSLSGGKANLHQGAIGAGVDLAGGKTLTAVWRNEVVSEHPDTGNSVENVAIPGWSDLLQIAAGASELTGLGYLGVDLVLDKNLGPMVLEMNARPGLNIQIANRAGLLARLQKVENSISTLTGLEQRVEFAQHNFASEL